MYTFTELNDKPMPSGNCANEAWLIADSSAVAMHRHLSVVI